MGRRKIQIKAITDEKTRLVTFAKRKNGLFKKAYELSVLCECEIALIVFTKSDRLHQYASYTMEHILHRRDAHPKSNEFYTNQGMCKLLKDRSLSLGGGLMTPKVDTDASSNLVIDEDFGSDSDRSAHQTSIAVKDRPLKPRGRPRVVRDNLMEKTYKPSPPHESNKPQEAVACNVSTVTVTANVDSLCNQSTARESSRLVSAYCRFPTSQTVDIDAEVKGNDDTLSNSITSLEAATTLARTLSTQTMMLHYAVLGHSPPLHDQGNMAGSSLHTLVLLPDLRLTGTTATAAGIIAGLPVRTADPCPLSLDKSDETSPKPTSASVTEVDDQELQSSQSADVPSDRSNACSLSETTLERTQFSTDANVPIDPSSTSASGNQILKLEPSKSNDVTTHTCSFRAKRRPSLTLLKLPSSSQTQPSPASGVIPKGTFLPTPVLEAELKKLECQPSPFGEALRKLTPCIPDAIRPDIAAEADRCNPSEALVSSQSNNANKSAHLMSVPLPKTPTTPNNSFPTYGSSLCRSPDIFVVPFLGIVNSGAQENSIKTLTSASESDSRPPQSILSSCAPSTTRTTPTSLGGDSITDSLKTCAVKGEPSGSRKFKGKHQLSLTLPPRSLENMMDDSPLLGVIPQGTFLSTPDVVTELEKLEFPSASMTWTNGNAIKREVDNPPSSDLPICQPKSVFEQSIATDLCAPGAGAPGLRTSAFTSTSTSGCTSPVSSSSSNHVLCETRQVDLPDADVITGKHAKRRRRT